jgi:hypothetical protein
MGKDGAEIFSVPVDVSVAPQYFEYVSRPMDFGTIRKQLRVSCSAHCDACHLRNLRAG